MKGGRRKEGKDGGILTGQRETFESDAYIHCLDFDDGFMYIYICQNLSKYTLYVQLTVCQLLLSNAIFKN